MKIEYRKGLSRINKAIIIVMAISCIALTFSVVSYCVNNGWVVEDEFKILKGE